MRKLIFIIITLFCLVSLWGKDLQLKIMDKELQMPLEGVKVIVVNTGKIQYSDANGELVIQISESDSKIIITASLIGYESIKKRITALDQTAVIEMSIAGILEGEEIVIEEEAIGQTDEEVGVSTVVDREELKSTAMIGVIEDVMASIKVLPGVSYAGSFGSFLSVRGGKWDEMTTALDGFIVRYPYHWGGAFSIFNPNAVDSVKFSAGIFSVKHGQAMSALMEVNSLKPDAGMRVDSKFSTSTVEVHVHPFASKKMGLYLNGRITYYDLVVLMMNPILKEMGMSFSRTPYIYSTQLKWFWKPHERVEWYVNGFFGTDGVGMKSTDNNLNDKKNIVNKFDFNWYNYYTIVNTGVKILPVDKISIHYLIGYDFLTNGTRGFRKSSGTRQYSDDFKEEYGLFLMGEEQFSMDAISKFGHNSLVHGLQTRVDLSFDLHARVQMETGSGVYLDFNRYDSSGNSWGVNYENGLPLYKNNKYHVAANDSQILKSFLYLNFLFQVIPERFKIETGCRVDHSVIWGADNFRLNTYPVPSPRLNLTVTPLKNLGRLDYLTFSAGVGLLSKTPLASDYLNEDYNLKDFDIAIPKCLSTVLGSELGLPLGFKFKLEGYYKYYFHRNYMNAKKVEQSDQSYKNEFIIHGDGVGHSAGFDVSLEKKVSRFIDGLISYTFIYTRLYNPMTDGLDSKVSINGQPTGSWFYPSYHRYHSFNIVLNIKPVRWMTITPKFSLASGLPKMRYEEKNMFLARVENEDGSKTIAEMYSRNKKYDDYLRNIISIPFDLKVSFHFFIPKRKIRLETYFAGEDLFSYVYFKAGLVSKTSEINLFTGEEIAAPSAQFGGFPRISFGIKISY